MLRAARFLAIFGFWGALNASAANWVRAGLNTNQLVWGARGGLQFAIHPAGFRPGEPRGLIRLGYPVLPNGGYDLINFIAVEPVVNGKKGFSELERSRLDNLPGKGIWPAGDGDPASAAGSLDAGVISRLAGDVEQLEVSLRVEKFDNGAHVRLIISQRSDWPDEITLTVRSETDSAPIEFCVLTATMGNMARARQLWLNDETINSLKLYPDYKDAGFAPHTFFSLDRLRRTAEGDVVVAVTTDELDPAGVSPFPNSQFWQYKGCKVTQFWKKRKDTVHDDLQAAVNARYTYYGSHRPIPGGIAFENFELRERFHDGQQFVFGITAKSPPQLGWSR
jgi:hypothetical protein